MGSEFNISELSINQLKEFYRLFRNNIDSKVVNGSIGVETFMESIRNITGINYDRNILTDVF